jgi:transcriptional regulator with XRE-family HTH domain
VNFKKYSSTFWGNVGITMKKQELDFYILCDYQFTLSNINFLIKSGFIWDDFVDYSDRVQRLNENRPALVTRIINTLPLIDEQHRNNNLYQLAHAGLSLTNIKMLIELGLEYNKLGVLTLEHLNSLAGGNKKSLYLKVTAAYEIIENLKGNASLTLVETCMLDLINSLQPREVITFKSLKERVERELQDTIEIKLVENFVEKNIKTGLLIKQENGFTKKYKRILELLSEEFLNKDLLLMRMNGMSLQDIANISGVTRQAISFKENRILKRIVDLEEFYLYKDIFERFDWSQQLFCDLFNEPIEVYQLLNLKFRKGNENPLALLNDEENNLSDSQINIILNGCESFIDYKERIMPLSKTTIFDEVIYNYCKDYSEDQKVIKRFNNYLLVNGLDEKYKVDSNAVRGMSERCSVIIRTRSNRYRYYDYDVIDETVKRKLEDKLELSPGIYNMIKIFSENKDFMREIDIRSEHELHNLYKRMIVKDGVNYNRMPEFSIGRMNKNEFLIKLFFEQAPINIDEFTLFVEENYGLRFNSLKSHINMYLNEYVHGDIIKVDYHEIDETELNKLKNLLKADIYTVDQLTKIGKNVDNDFHDKFLNNMILSKIGYSLKGKYVLRNKYGTVDKFFKEHILSQDYFSKQGLELYNTSVFNRTLYDLEKELDVVKIENDIYITAKKLEDAEVTKSLLLDFREQVLDIVDENQYFTLYSLRQNDFIHDIDELGFDSFFYDRIIWTSEKVRAIPLASGYIFIKKEKDISLIDFIRFLVERVEIINIYDMRDYVEKYYGISLDLSRVLALVRDTDMYYSEDLSRLYINKNTFFEEIY